MQQFPVWLGAMWCFHKHLEEKRFFLGAPCSHHVALQQLRFATLTLKTFELKCLYIQVFLCSWRLPAQTSGWDKTTIQMRLNLDFICLQNLLTSLNHFELVKFKTEKGSEHVPSTLPIDSINELIANMTSLLKVETVVWLTVAVYTFSITYL